MIASFLILTVGAVDLVAPVARPAIRRVSTAIVLVALSAVAVCGLGIDFSAVLAIVVVAVAWLLLMPWQVGTSVAGRARDARSSRSGERAAPRRPRIWPVSILVVAVVLAMLVGPNFESGPAPLVAAYGSALAGAPDLVAGVSFSAMFAAAAIVIFLTQSANAIVRNALGPASPPLPLADSAPVKAKGRRGRPTDSVEPAGEIDTPSVLKGGRLIGPLERILIVVLAFSGMATVIAAVIAAKGIVRFPEISSDRGAGSKAEQFLVGTLTSCALAAAAALYLYGTAG
ncbi:hypothetical protein ACFSBZ_04740 [Amnibacterium flavum]|uniref:Uncharacterized protein n=1 Tax=Amnibacterium flavum TaxID=2173173 RepID=A0A2V1HPF6_9MICO|nr:hypothetical protein [Amnibacterium flavum]PVZ94211.1 hypothetical protein DDQ50_10735 [Amnibacterium flavum]